MKTYRVCVFPKNGTAFYVMVMGDFPGDARNNAQAMYPDSTIGTATEV